MRVGFAFNCAFAVEKDDGNAGIGNKWKGPGAVTAAM